MLSTVTSSMPAPSTPAARTAQPAAAAPAADGPTAGTPAQGGGRAAVVHSVRPFAQWLGQQAGAVPALQSALPGVPAVADLPGADVAQAAAGAAPAHDAAPDDATDNAAAPAPQDALLAAMAMPLMPLPSAQVAQALQAAQGRPADGARTAGDDAPDARTTAAASGGGDGGRRAAALSSLPAAVAAPAVPVVAAAPAAPATTDTAAATTGAATPRVAVHTAAAGADADDGGAGNADSRGAAPHAVAATPASGTPPGQPSGDTVRLAGPPTAWRQSLQEALGERLNVQVGKNVEQAVIRLEPPQLGRIDIAIRHSAGVLEVTISATNSEVLRQLQSVSDNLRSDLAQRQYTEVAVTVAPAPKNNATPFGDPQQQGRGRQQGREQEESTPGRALAEAGNPGSAFSLGGRD